MLQKCSFDVLFGFGAIEADAAAREESHNLYIKELLSYFLLSDVEHVVCFRVDVLKTTITSRALYAGLWACHRSLPVWSTRIGWERALGPQNRCFLPRPSANPRNTSLLRWELPEHTPGGS